MTKGLTRSMRRAPPTRSQIIKVTHAIRNLPLTVAGVTGIGFGGANIRGLPEGNVLVLGAVCDLVLSTVDPGVTATFTGSFSVGTTLNADTTLSGDDVNILPATTLAAATAQVSPLTTARSNSQGIINNTQKGRSAMYLNVLIDDASISSSAPCIANGFLSIAYLVLGDD